MLVSDVMTRPAVTVRTDTPIAEALDRLERNSLRMMPVLSPAGFFVGVVRKADLVREVTGPHVRARAIPAQRPGSTTPDQPSVLQVMNHRAVTVSGNTDLADAMALMSDAHAESLPVIDAHHRVVGVIGHADIARQGATR